MADEVVVEGRILEWGNSYGIRIRKADLDRAGLSPGEEATIRIVHSQGPIDLSGLPAWGSGHRDTSRRHDDVLGEARAAALRKGARARR
jgi:hypothetical protein